MWPNALFSYKNYSTPHCPENLPSLSKQIYVSLCKYISTRVENTFQKGHVEVLLGVASAIS